MTNNEQRVLGDLRIFQAVFNDLNMKHELVQLADGSSAWVYTYEGVDPYELDDSHFPTITRAIAEERAKAAKEACRKLVLNHNYHGDIEKLELKDGIFYMPWVRVIGNMNGWWGKTHETEAEARRQLADRLIEVSRLQSQESSEDGIEYDSPPPNPFGPPVDVSVADRIPGDLTTIARKESGETLGMKVKVDDRIAGDEIRFDHPDGRSEVFKL